MPLYVLCPGWVRSPNDGDEHFISAPMLAQLYGVPMELCSVWHGNVGNARNVRNMGRTFPEGKALRPKADGDYTLHD